MSDALNPGGAARTTVHLVRHGEVHNPEKILYGRIPGYHLSSRGHSMAARTAESFRDHDVTYLAASPLQRAVHTATPAAAAGTAPTPWTASSPPPVASGARRTASGAGRGCPPPAPR